MLKFGSTFPKGGLESLPPCPVAGGRGPHQTIPAVRFVDEIFAVIITQRIRAIIIHFIVR